jgi:hypothetical protein
LIILNRYTISVFKMKTLSWISIQEGVLDCSSLCLEVYK